MSFKKIAIKAAIPALVAALMTSTLASASPIVSTHQAVKKAAVVRIGYFANLTHAPALIARQKALFEKYLGAGTKVEYTIFSAGPAAIEALKGNALDISYIGPNPSIAGYLSTDGALLNIVSGATSGGARFIVKPGLIATAGKPTAAEISALKGKTFATPQLGGTQDVALRAYLKSKGLTFSGGSPDVNISPSENSTTLTLFKNGGIDGAWVPEPWATRLIQEGSGKVFIDEKDLWSKGKYITTNIVVKKDFLKSYPDTVKAVLQANNEAIAFLNKPANKQASIDYVQAELLARTSKNLSDAVIQEAWTHLSFTADPLPETLRKNFVAAVRVGQLSNYLQDDLRGIYNLKVLNSLRAKNKQLSVPSALR